jgi:hypothetical protein
MPKAITETEKTYRRVNHWRFKNLGRARAQSAVANAVRDHDLERKPCEICGTDFRVCAFHDDYSKPLKVRWRCRGCNHRLKLERRDF